MPTALEIKKIFSFSYIHPQRQFCDFCCCIRRSDKIKWDVKNIIYLTLSAMSPWRIRFNLTAQNDANCKNSHSDNIFLTQIMHEASFCRTIYQNMWELTSKSSTCSLNLIRRIVRPHIWLYLFNIINKGCLDGCVFDWIAFLWASATCFILNSHSPRFMFDPFFVHKNSSLPSITAFTGGFAIVAWVKIHMPLGSLLLPLFLAVPFS